MREKWKSIDWLRGISGWYEVSNFGRVRRATPGINTHVGRMLTPSPDSKSGYMRVTLHANQTIHREQVHRLVARAFISGFEPVRQINHKNGDKTDNSVENLEWVTPRQNVIHAWKNGFCNPNQGEAHGGHKLTESEAKAALYLLANGVSGKLIASALNITQSAVSSLKRGETWKHLTHKNHV